MKITNNQVTPNLGLDKTKSEGLEKSLGRGVKDAGGSSVDGPAKVDLSPKAQAMQKAKSIASADTIDHEKVSRLQKLIDAGEYKVDAKAVADRLVDDHLLMS